MTGSFTALATVMIGGYVGHDVADHWVQTHTQATQKIEKDGATHCLHHVIYLQFTKLGFVALIWLVTGVHLNAWTLLLGATIDALMHYAADRQEFGILPKLAKLVNKTDFWEFGDKIIAPCGTGAYKMDQSWHVFWIFVWALISSVGVN